MALGIFQPATGSQAPGTELLVDNEQTSTQQAYGHSNLKHAEGKGTAIILIPQPSADPNDPLLWPAWKRELAFVFLFFNCIVFAAAPGPLIAPGTVALAMHFKMSITKISALSGYQLLVVGALGPIVSVLAQKYGKRPQFLFASTLGLIGTGICIAGFNKSSLTDSYNVLFAGRLVQGLGTTAYESLSVATIGDMFYLHQRGTRTALLVLTLACLSSFVSIIAGVAFQNLGAKLLFVMLAVFQAFGWVGTVFFLPETQFRRDSSPVMVDSSEAAPEKGAHQTASEDSITQRSNIPKRSFVQDLRPFSGTYTPKNIFVLLFEIFIHLLNPAVLWIMLVSACLVSFFVGFAYTIAQIFSPPPYLLSVAQNGYFFTGALVGGLLGVSAGPICDVSARALAKRNGGVYEPEFRIPVCILSVILFAIGWFVFGWALDHPSHNRVYLASFCYGAVCWATSVSSTSAGLYILDAFKGYSTEIFILQMMVKNFLFYAFSTFVNDWAAKGPGHMCRVFGAVTVAGFVTCIPMYMFGKINRVWMYRLWSKMLGEK